MLDYLGGPMQSQEGSWRVRGRVGDVTTEEEVGVVLGQEPTNAVSSRSQKGQDNACSPKLLQGTQPC